MWKDWGGLDGLQPGARRLSKRRFLLSRGGREQPLLVCLLLATVLPVFCLSCSSGCGAFTALLEGGFPATRRARGGCERSRSQGGGAGPGSCSQKRDLRGKGAQWEPGDVRRLPGGLRTRSGTKARSVLRATALPRAERAAGPLPRKCCSVNPSSSTEQGSHLSGLLSSPGASLQPAPPAWDRRRARPGSSPHPRTPQRSRAMDLPAPSCQNGRL